MAISHPVANTAQIDFWNGPTGQRWSKLHKQIEASMRPFAEALIQRLAPKPGERIVDIGCGAGDTALALADRVQGHGMVLGLDVSRLLLQHAVARAANTPEYPLRFVEADAATYALERGGWDALFSRFGVMFFADPAAAFANLRRGLKPGGRLAFCCWRDRRENAWVTLPVAAARKHIAELPPAPGPEEPGPFSFADTARIRRVLTSAGFTGIEIDRFDPSLSYGNGPAETAQFLCEMGPVG
ncbi:MAG: class I SAM-dependent methyltransferase, partial [Rhodospirillaceae bacterium]|nr:class I SAM-dependent methyltransferase [Rhodospirillaceae bacterium]